MLKPLLVCPSPRDIQQVFDLHDKISYDKLYAKYYNEKNAYQNLQRYFLDNKQYTHFCICPDDLLINERSFQLLIKDIREKDPPIISGVCNLVGDCEEINICLNYVGNSINNLNYQWVKKENNLPRFLQVGFSGFSCEFIRRDIMEKYTFTGIDCGSGGIICGFDTGFSHICHENNIPVLVDQKARFVHLKGLIDDDIIQNLWVGRKDPKMIFVAANNSYNSGVIVS